MTDIPDEATFPGANEAWQPAARVSWRGWAAAVEAAAPHIARQAQVAMLREVCGEIGHQADATRHDDTIESSVLERVHGQIRARIIELEASGGQTEEE